MIKEEYTKAYIKPVVIVNDVLTNLLEEIEQHSRKDEHDRNVVLMSALKLMIKNRIRKTK